MKCQEVHGENYSYDNFKNSTIFASDKVKIKCNKHNYIFEQKLCTHMRGSGCPECKKDKLRSCFSSNSFVKEANIIHKGRYDYQNVMYKNNRTPISIICAKHGVFKQRPGDHLKGCGCPKCRVDKIKTLRVHKIEDFLRKAKEVHGDLFNYSLVEYINWRSKIKIICKVHGIFEQEAGSHLRGTGCPSCWGRISKAEIKWLNELGIPNDGEHRQVKINVNNRYYTVDGYDPRSKTIYLFNGDYWHGNPKKFSSTDINTRNKKTFGELYDNTILMEKTLKEHGYNVISKWDTD